MIMALNQLIKFGNLFILTVTSRALTAIAGKFGDNIEVNTNYEKTSNIHYSSYTWCVTLWHVL